MILGLLGKFLVFWRNCIEEVLGLPGFGFARRS